jgi:hypothetical protein
MQKGEHKSFDLSCESLSWFEANSVLLCAELSASISAQGIHESIRKMIDNIALVSFTVVKVRYSFTII